MTPFLVLFAERSNPEPELVLRKDIVQKEVIDLSAFHTRCGHPRHVDD